jgi:hypothetical protein
MPTASDIARITHLEDTQDDTTGYQTIKVLDSTHAGHDDTPGNDKEREP